MHYVKPGSYKTFSSATREGARVIQSLSAATSELQTLISAFNDPNTSAADKQAFSLLLSHRLHRLLEAASVLSAQLEQLLDNTTPPTQPPNTDGSSAS